MACPFIVWRRRRGWTICCAIDGERFDMLDAVDLGAFRARFAQSDEPIVFSVGRLTHEKGTHLLIEAVPRVVTAHPETKFVIAGTGEMADGLKARVAALGIREN